MCYLLDREYHTDWETWDRTEDRNGDMSGRAAESQELLEPATAEEALLAATLGGGSRAEERDEGNQPSQSSSQLSQGTAEFCLHKTKPDWATKRSYTTIITVQGEYETSFISTSCLPCFSFYFSA